MQQCQPLESESPPNTDCAPCIRIGAVLTQRCQSDLLSHMVRAQQASLLMRVLRRALKIKTISGREVDSWQVLL